MSEDRLASCLILEGERFAAIWAVIDRTTHDVNNLLLPVIAYPALVRRELREDSRAREMVDGIEGAGENILHIMRQLMALRPNQGTVQEKASLNGVAEGIVQSVRAEGTVSPHRIVVDCPASDVRVVVDSERIRVAVEALLRNALESLRPDGGTVNVIVRGTDVEAGQFGSVPERAGASGSICVVDDGEGFGVEAGKRIFDPFFTTRRSQSRRGAGLGLSIVYRVAVDYGGWITYRSEPGKGSAFTLYLPCE